MGKIGEGQWRYRLTDMEWIIPGNQRYNINDIVSLYGNKWCYTCCEYSITYTDVESLYCTTETNITLSTIVKKI